LAVNDQSGGSMRLFIGIALDDAARGFAARQAGELRGALDGNFTARDNYHITLAFLGMRGGDELAALRRAMDAAARRAAFSVSIGGLGCFAKGKRQVVWMGVERTQALLDAQAALSKELRAAGVDFAGEDVYRPHITLARNCHMAELPVHSARMDMCVERITLFESARREGRLAYSPLYSARLMVNVHR
jgi:2'-5' RNA ligase